MPQIHIQFVSKLEFRVLVEMFSISRASRAQAPARVLFVRAVSLQCVLRLSGIALHPALLLTVVNYNYKIYFNLFIWQFFFFDKSSCAWQNVVAALYCVWQNVVNSARWLNDILPYAVKCRYDILPCARRNVNLYFACLLAFRISNSDWFTICEV